MSTLPRSYPRENLGDWRTRQMREDLTRDFYKYTQFAFDKPAVTTGVYLENGRPAGSVLIASEGCRKSVQVIPDKPDYRRGQGW